MALPGDSILVTPGSGATVATETVSSKEYEVWIEADAYGHLTGSRSTWVGSQTGTIFVTGTQNLCALWNGSGSGVVLEVMHYACNMEDTLNDTASLGAIFVRMYRITSAPSAGTTRTPVKYRSGQSSLPSQVLFYQHGVTATASGDAIGITNIGLNGGAAMSFPSRRMFDRELLTLVEPIILAEDEGVVVQQGDNNNVNTGGAQMLHFRVR